MVGLEQYTAYAIKMIDLIDRRLIKDEVIPAAEKIYSIFEPHTEWITKGKLNKKAEYRSPVAYHYRSASIYCRL